MCTLTVLLRATARHSLIVAANRDEDRTRPARAPFVWDGSPRFLAGRDERAGGTWMGINARGLFAGLTNLWTGESADGTRRSRGEVVVSLLRCLTLQQTRGVLAKLDARAFNPFMVVCATTAGDGFWASTAEELEPHELARGLFALGNFLPEDPGNAKLRRAAATLAAEPLLNQQDDGALLQGLQAALSAHHGDWGPRESLCVHTEGNYGTVSSTILLAPGELETGRLLHAPGPPCTTPYEDLTPLLERLGRP